MASRDLVKSFQEFCRSQGIVLVDSATGKELDSEDYECKD